MTPTALAQLAVLVIALAATTRVLGAHLAGVYGAEGTKAYGSRAFLPVERLVYRACGVDERQEQRWTTYARSVLAFSLVSTLLLYGLQRLQGHLPLARAASGAVRAVAPFIALNTAVSFVTNTNWQAYAGESTMSHLTQAVGLTVQNFVSAAVGMAVAVALVRGLTRRRSETIGNFWVDLTRSITRVLLPLAFVFAVVLLAAGSVQSWTGATHVRTVEGAAAVVPGGPVASQEAIKIVGTNGGGFFNANSAHPFEDPNGFTSWLQVLSLLAISFALTYAFGRFAKSQRQGWVLFAVAFGLWAATALVAMGAEQAGNPELARAGVTQTAGSGQAGGNLEGKEVRFGAAQSGLFAASTTGTSTGAVISSHDSHTPVGGMVPLVAIMLGEVSPGGVGAGLQGLLVLALLSVFIAGLMVGRTPEYLGKKVQASEIKLVAIYILVMPVIVLALSAAAATLPTARAAVGNPGAHGLAEVVYAYASAANNNGSAFGGLTATSDWYTTTTALAMLAGRFLLIVAVLGIAGSLARKRTSPATAGTFPTGTPLFAGLVTGVTVIVGALTFFPVLALSLVAERLSL
jgi:K+-transporting ATPase ATPase A chain